ncbi:S-layer homology domain-containing protein [Pseudoflavonifractor hominis]|uniref:S-layer homology domain-containing protein n=1 Tax=Pseudoflavonifractor hominis TaxID=2763059 RepID=UPI00344F4B72
MPYTSGQFTDVSSDAWYAESVRSACEFGLLYGSSATTFTPSGNVSLAQAIALACRLHSIYYADQAVFSNGATWYQPYIDYAIQNGILTAGTYSDYNANATRAQFASILAAALPESALAPINDIASIPDVSAADSYADAVYRLYNAGIIKGKDRYGTFAPESSIQRAEAATIVTLMADPSMRTSFTLDFKLTPQALQGVWRYEERDPDSDYVEYRELIFDGEESIRIFYHENYSGIDHTVPKTGYDLYSRGRVTTEEKATFTNPNASAAAYAQWGIFTNDFVDWRGSGDAKRLTGRISDYVSELNLEEGYLVLVDMAYVSPTYRRYERVSTEPVSDLRTGAESQIKNLDALLATPVPTPNPEPETPEEPVQADPISFGTISLQYIYDRLKFPSTMNVVEMRYGPYDRVAYYANLPDWTKPSGNILSLNHDYYVVKVTLQAANSLGALVTDTYVFLFDLTTGKTIYDFENWAHERVEMSWGATKSEYMSLESEALFLAASVKFQLFTEEETQSIVRTVTSG